MSFDALFLFSPRLLTFRDGAPLDRLGVTMPLTSLSTYNFVSVSRRFGSRNVCAFKDRTLMTQIQQIIADKNLCKSVSSVSQRTLMMQIQLIITDKNLCKSVLSVSHRTLMTQIQQIIADKNLCKSVLSVSHRTLMMQIHLIITKKISSRHIVPKIREPALLILQPNRFKQINYPEK